MQNFLFIGRFHVEGLSLLCVEVHTQSNMYVYKREPSWNPNSKTAESDRPQHECHAACVIAQQYSSTTFVL